MFHQPTRNRHQGCTGTLDYSISHSVTYLYVFPFSSALHSLLTVPLPSSSAAATIASTNSTGPELVSTFTPQGTSCHRHGYAQASASTGKMCAPVPHPLCMVRHLFRFPCTELHVDDRCLYP